MAENKLIDKAVDLTDGKITKEEAAQPDYERVFQVYENTRVPVSKSMGSLWKERQREADRKRKQCGTTDRWDEVISYYQNDQGGRTGKRKRLSELATGRSSEKMYLTENIVFANISALVPATYTKNPDVEITAATKEEEPRAKLFEKLIDTLFKLKRSPGMNMKPLMKREIVMCLLTNVAYAELSYTKKEESSEQVIQELEKLSKELETAKDVKIIEQIEGQLLALEDKVTILTESGPKLKMRHPKHVILDPDGDGTVEGSNYIMVGEHIRTSYLRAVYGRKKESDDKTEATWMSIFKPTHVLAGDDKESHDDPAMNFKLLDGETEHEKYGFKSKRDFDHSCHTFCWYVWDKVTRRVYLFADHDWTWPIWVWDDPYKLSRFYPIFQLTFTTDPEEHIGRSEVMYYLDHQDEINRISNERARMRHWASSKIFVNSNVVKSKASIEKFLKDDTENLVQAIDIPENMKISDMVGAFPVPSTQFEQLFDTRPLLEGVNRLSSVTPVLQNAQFKTNTTNKAIESYESSTQLRLDEKIDAIEEFMGDIGTAVLEMCVQFMPVDQVNSLLGARFVEDNGGWSEGMSVEELNQTFSFQIVGGSTLKPTSKVKKEQAAQLGQILGQFANASPMIVLVLLKMLERAYGDDVVITDDDWTMIIESTTAQMQRGGPQQGGQQQQGQQQQQQQAEGADTNAVMDQVAQIIDNLPPEAKTYLAKSIVQGKPLKQIVSELMQAAQARPQQ